MSKSLLFIVAVVFSMQLVAQEASLLQKYKFRTNRYNALNLLFNTGAQSSNSHNNFFLQKSSGGNFAIGANLLSFKSSDNTLQVITANLPLQVNLLRNANAPNVVKINQFNMNQDFIINQKWYSQKNRFIELGFGVNSIYSDYTKKETVNNPFTTKNQQRTFNTNLTLGIGSGRLENITDMQNALWLQKALQEEGKLKNNLSESQANGLAQTITRAGNFRILDGRRRTKYILKEVDKYIATNNLVDKRDIDYFSSMNDILFFANNFQRLSGTEKYIRITPCWGKDQRNFVQDNGINGYSNKNTLTELAMDLKIGFQKFKPIDLKHQFNYGIEFKTRFLRNKTLEKQFNNEVLTNTYISQYEEKRAGLNYFMQYSLYPNSRTVVNFNLRGDNGVSHAPNGLRFYHDNSVSVSGNYFINYNTCLFFDFGINHQSNHFNNSINNRSTNLFFNVGLRIGL